MRRLIRLVAGAAALLVSLYASAAVPLMHFSIFRPCDGNGAQCATTVLVQGEFERDSAKQLAAYLQSPSVTKEGGAIGIAFNSVGGSVTAALEMGQMIRAAGMRTYLAPAYKSSRDNDGVPTVFAKDVICASACTLAFLGGVVRTVEPGSQFGVHQFSSKKEIGDSATQSAIVQLVAYIEGMGVDRRMLDYGLMKKPDEINWIPDQAIHDLRIDNSEPPLSPWSLTATPNGEPMIMVRQNVALDKDAVVAFSKSNKKIQIMVAAIYGLTKSEAFPAEGQQAEFGIFADHRPVNLTGMTKWMSQKAGQPSYFAFAILTEPEFLKIAHAKTLSLTDGFAYSEDFASIKTEISVDKLGPDAALLLRVK